MAPALATGDEVLYHPRGALRPGDFIVAKHPFKQGVTLIKQVKSLDARGHLFVVGLNPRHSTDSRSFGALPPRLVLGRVTCRIPKESR
jgi:nickel-type superoxide dismutase maturation protease